MGEFLSHKARLCKFLKLPGWILKLFKKGRLSNFIVLPILSLGLGELCFSFELPWILTVLDTPFLACALRVFWDVVGLHIKFSVFESKLP
jgi:hypothetical protein